VSINQYVDQAIPHEAGHLVVGWALGIPIWGLTVDIVRNGEERVSGHVRTLSIGSSNEAIPGTQAAFMARYRLFVAGLAANLLDGAPAAEDSLESDRKMLARLGTASLEEVADRAAEILVRYPDVFHRVNSLIRQRFLRLMEEDSLRAETYPLLSEQDLADIVSKS
jgi:hypothetical protein